MAATKTKSRNILEMRDKLRVSLSSIIPRWECLVAAKQAQSYHGIKVVITYMSYNKYSLLDIGGFLKASPRKISVLNRSARQKTLPTPGLHTTN